MRAMPSVLLACFLTCAQLSAEPSGHTGPKAPDPGPKQFAWSGTVNGLQLRLIPDKDTYLSGEVMRFHVQFRNTLKEELLLDLAKLHDTSRSYYLPENANRPSFTPFGDTLLMPGRPQPLRIGPGEILTFTRRTRGEFSGGRLRVWQLYGPFGHENTQPWCSLKEQKDGAFEVQYSHVVAGTATRGQKLMASGLWTGEVASPPVRIVIRKMPARYGEHEKKPVLYDWAGGAAGELRTGLVPQEARVAVGRPCWFRLNLWNQSGHARMYAPAVNLLKPGGLLVTDEQGKAVPCTGEGPADEAAFRIMQPNASFVLCEFDLAAAYDLSGPGRYRVQFPATGGAHQQEVLLPASNIAEFDVVAEFTETVDRVPGSVFTIAGTVLSADKRPVADTAVFMGPWGKYRVTLPPELRTAEGVRRVHTDAVGRFRLSAVRPGRYWIVARHETRGSVLGTICFVERPAEEYELRLLPGDLSGALAAKDGTTPLEGIPVQLLESNRWRTAERQIETTTDAEGRFWFPAVVKGAYWVRAALSERPWRYAATQVALDGRDLEVRLQAPRGQLSGTVKTPEGVKVPNANLWLSSRDKRGVLNSFSAATDAEGKFLFDEVPWGKYGLRVKGPPKGPHAKGFESDYGGKDITLVEESPRVSIDIVLRDETSKTAAKAALVIRGADGRPLANQTLLMLMKNSEWSEKTDATGTVRHGLSLEREYHLRILVREVKGWALVSVPPADLREGRTIEVTLQPCGEARGRVLDERTGRALGGISIHPEPEAQSEEPPCVATISPPKSSVSRHGDGSFHFSALPPGQYEIRKDHDDSSRHPVRFNVVAGEVTKDILVALAAPEGAVALNGQLIDAAGTPVANQEVILFHDQPRMSLSLAPPSRARTDAQGRFTLYPVTPGYHGYHASLRDGSFGSLTKVEVKPGRDLDGVLFRLRETVKQASQPSVGPPDPPGAWGKTIDEWRIRVTPNKPKFRCWERVEVRVELENLSRLPRTYSPPSLVVVRPDGKRPRNVEMPCQIVVGNYVPTIAAGAKVTTGRSVSHGVDLTMAGKYRVQGYSPPSNVAEFEVLPHDPDRPLPPVAEAIPSGLVDGIESVLPKGWHFMGTDEWERGKKDLSSPRRVLIMYRGELTTTETLRIGPVNMELWLYLYDRRYQGPDPIEKHRKDGKSLRLLGETDWYRAYASGQPDARLGWKDPDGDLAAALKLRGPQKN